MALKLPDIPQVVWRIKKPAKYYINRFKFRGHIPRRDFILILKADQTLVIEAKRVARELLTAYPEKRYEHPDFPLEVPLLPFFSIYDVLIDLQKSKDERMMHGRDFVFNDNPLPYFASTVKILLKFNIEEWLNFFRYVKKFFRGTNWAELTKVYYLCLGMDIIKWRRKCPDCGLTFYPIPGPKGGRPSKRCPKCSEKFCRESTRKRVKRWRKKHREQINAEKQLLRAARRRYFSLKKWVGTLPWHTYPMERKEERRKF